MKDLEVINIEMLAKEICEIYQKAVDDFWTESDAEKYALECVDVEEVAQYRAELINRDFNNYLFGRDRKGVNSWDIPGNFCDIRYNYEQDTEKDFHEILRKLQDEPESEDAKEFREYAVTWFFRAFGTYGLTYNFTDYLIEYVDELVKEYETI